MTERLRDHLLAAIITSTGSVSAQAATGVSLILAARHCSLREFGFLTAAAGAASLLCDLQDFGTSQLMSRDLARSPDALGLYEHLWWLRARVAGVVGGAGIVSMAISGGEVGAAAGLAAYSTIQALNALMSARLRADGRFQASSACVAFERWVGLLALVVCVYVVGMNGLLAYPAGLLIGGFVAACLMTVMTKIKRAMASTRRALKKVFADARSFAASSLLSDLQLADTSVVAGVAGSGTAAIFAVGTRLTAPLGGPANALSVVLLPRISRRADNETWRTALRSIAVLVGVLVAVFTAIFVFAEPLIRFAFGARYAAAATPARLFLVATLVASANQPLAAMLQAVGWQRRVGILVGSTAFLSLAVAAVGARVDGATGASAGFLCMQVLIALVLIRWQVLVSRSLSAWSTREAQV